MKVAMYYNNHDVRFEDMAQPAAGPGELLVKVMASGICGSDVMEWYRIKKAPRVLGHEIAGEVIQVGEGVESYRVGDRVFVSHHVPCNTCHYCLSDHHTVCDLLRNTNFHPGGFAEYLRVPRINVDRGTFLIPDGMSYEEAVFIEPLACVYRGLKAAQLRPGQSLLIVGSGITGLLMVQAARTMGAGRIIATDISDFRLDTARRVGADVALKAADARPGKLMELNGGRLPDAVIVCTAARTAISQAFSSVGRGGTILFFAPTEPGVEVAMPLHDIWKDEVSIVTSYGGSPHDLQVAIELIRSRAANVTQLITHRLPLEKAAEGFGLVADAKDSIKVILYPHGADAAAAGARKK